ncbi:hypothetical protein NDI49_31620 [Trichocoleus sp. ST-U3]
MLKQEAIAKAAVTHLTSTAASRELKPLIYSHQVPWVVVMLEYNSLQYLPTEEDLPETDNTPVDNELQILIPNLLRAILALYFCPSFQAFRYIKTA